MGIAVNAISGAILAGKGWIVRVVTFTYDPYRDYGIFTLPDDLPEGLDVHPQVAHGRMAP